MTRRELSLHLKIIALVLSATPALLGQEMIPNGTFDSGIDGWSVDSNSSGTIDWSATQGQPPGAVRFVGEDQWAWPTTCFQFAPGTFIFSADGFMETSGEFISCNLNFMMFSTADDCTGSWGVFPIIDSESLSPFVENPNQWEHLEMRVPIPDDPVNSTGVRSFRPILVKFGDANDDDACVYDNVSLVLIPRTTIPTMSSVGFVTFAVLLAIAAAFVLRRSSS